MHLAHLQIDDKSVRVLEFSFEVHKDTDRHGVPQSMPLSGLIRVVVESSNKIDFFAWLVNEYSVVPDYKDGTISIKNPNNNRTYKEIKFTDGLCVSCREVFGQSEKGSQKALMNTELLISAKEITVGHTLVKNPWFAHQWKKDNPF